MTNKCFKNSVITLITLVAFLLVSGLVIGCSQDTTGPITQAEIKEQKEVINNYYKAINDKDYKKAYEMTTLAFQRGLSFPNFKYRYSAYLNSVEVNSISRLENFSEKNSGVYEVSFDVKYKQKYLYGDDNLPTVHVIKKEGNWKIDSIGVKNLE